ncbi:MAG: HAD-IIB family hydrolase [Candidatus Methanofastidiosia archaeon]
MNYETAVFDLDGILLKNGIMTKESKKAVTMLLKNQIRVIYSSGKNYWYTTSGISFMGLIRKDTIVIAENGGVIFCPMERKKKLLSKENEEIKIISDQFVKEHGVIKGDNLYFKENSTMLWREPKETIFTLFPVDTSIIPRLKELVDSIIKENNLSLYTIAHSDALDTVPRGQNKGKALEYLSKIDLIDLSKTIAFGDGNNDKEMLEIVGMPVTVGNAEEEIKNIVKRKNGIVSENSYGKGVLEAIGKIFGK